MNFDKETCNLCDLRSPCSSVMSSVAPAAQDPDSSRSGMHSRGLWRESWPDHLLVPCPLLR